MIPQKHLQGQAKSEQKEDSLVKHITTLHGGRDDAQQPLVPPPHCQSSRCRLLPPHILSREEDSSCPHRMVDDEWAGQGEGDAATFRRHHTGPVTLPPRHRACAYECFRVAFPPKGPLSCRATLSFG